MKWREHRDIDVAIEAASHGHINAERWLCKCCAFKAHEKPLTYVHELLVGAESQLLYPDSLNHLVWLALQHNGAPDKKARTPESHFEVGAVFARV